MNEEKDVIGTEFLLKGLLTILKSGTASFPAVVLVHGALDLDEKIGNIRFFKDFAEGLADYGIATIRYDMHTYTSGKQMVKTDDSKRRND